MNFFNLVRIRQDACRPAGKFERDENGVVGVVNAVTDDAVRRRYVVVDARFVAARFHLKKV
jgi:hypothetical protein